MEDVSAKGSTPKIYVLTLEGEEAIKNMHPAETKEKKTSSKPRRQHQRWILHMLQSTVTI